VVCFAVLRRDLDAFLFRVARLLCDQLVNRSIS
jgi:hypothetical protein